MEDIEDSPYKTLILDALKADLKKISDKLYTYKITAGDGASWKNNSTAALSFTANGAYKIFDYVEIDGKLLAASNYTAASGSTIITLNNAFLKTLSTGTHTIKVVYEDGGLAQGSFTVVDPYSLPKTGDGSNAELWFAALLLSAAGIVAIVPEIKRRKS